MIRKWMAGERTGADNSDNSGEDVISELEEVLRKYESSNVILCSKFALHYQPVRHNCGVQMLSVRKNPNVPLFTKLIDYSKIDWN